MSKEISNTGYLLQKAKETRPNVRQKTPRQDKNVTEHGSDCFIIFMRTRLQVPSHILPEKHSINRVRFFQVQMYLGMWIQ